MARGGTPVKRAYVDIPQGQIHYRTAGNEGPAVLLLHLTTGSSDCFADIIPILATRHRVFAMDRLGHGSSDPCPDDVTMEALVGYVLDFMDALGLDRTSIAGQSTGSYEGVEMAIAHPERVEKLVLLRLPDWTDEERVKRMAEERLVPQHGAPPQMDGSHVMDEWNFRRDFMISQATTPEMMHRMCMASFESMPARRDVSIAVGSHNIQERLHLLKVPTFFMTFELSPQPLTELDISLMPSTTPVETALIKGAGALAAMERPEEFARAIMDFLAKP